MIYGHPRHCRTPPPWRFSAPFVRLAFSDDLHKVWTVRVQSSKPPSTSHPASSPSSCAWGWSLCGDPLLIDLLYRCRQFLASMAQLNTILGLTGASRCCARCSLRPLTPLWFRSVGIYQRCVGLPPPAGCRTFHNRFRGLPFRLHHCRSFSLAQGSRP